MCTNVPVIALTVLLLLSGAGAAEAVDASLDIPETVLNVVLGKIGALSDSGVKQTYHTIDIGHRFRECVQVGVLACPVGPAGPAGVPGLGDSGVPLVICRNAGGGIAVLPDKLVPWQWWVQNARIEVSSGSMSFTATVTTHVGDAWNTETRTVGATARFDATDNKLKLEIGSFTVSLGAAGTLDVAKLYRIAVPITPQLISVAMPDGTTKSVTGKVASATVQYTPDKVTVNFDAAF